MNWKTLVAIVALSPVVAMFAGVGMLAYQIGQVWDERHTDQLITGMVATCGLVLAAFLLLCGATILLFYFLAKRRGDQQREDAQWREWRQLPSQGRPPSWAAGPPQIEDKSIGAWESMGPNNYDTWDADTIEGGWE